MDREGRKDGSRELKHGTKETERMGEKGWNGCRSSCRGTSLRGRFPHGSGNGDDSRRDMRQTHCAAKPNAARCVATCSVLRGRPRLHPLGRRVCCVQNGNVPDRCPRGASYPKRSPLPACPMLEAGRGLALRIVCRCLRPWERDALRLPWEACLQAVPWWCGAGGGGSEPYAEDSACDAFQRQRLVEEAVVGGSLL